MTDGSAGAESYVAILELSAEIGRAWNGDAFTAAVASMVYIGIDTTGASVLVRRSRQRTILWPRSDAYLRADPSHSDYQYEAADVYAAARCGLLHNYGSLAKDHRKSQPPRQFCYVDNGQHHKDETARVVVISVAALIDDYSEQQSRFVSAIFRTHPRTGNVVSIAAWSRALVEFWPYLPPNSLMREMLSFAQKGRKADGARRSNKNIL